MGNFLTYDAISPHDLQELQTMCSENPVELHMKIETSRVKEPTEHQPCDEDKLCGQTGSLLSVDQLVHLSGISNIDLSQRLGNTVRSTVSKWYTIVVVDCSGSMAGNPFNQIKMALEEIIGNVINDPKQTVDVVLYNTTATTVKYSQESYVEEIRNLKAHGKTSFNAAFQETEALIQKNQKQGFTETTIIFMTDGQDTVSHKRAVNECLEQWRKKLDLMCEHLIIHVVGFSRDHDLTLLRRIANSGNSEGIYRYCEPGDGPEALKDKLNELFDYVNCRENFPITFSLTFLDKNNTVVMSNFENNTVEGSMKIEDTGTQSILNFIADFWVRLSDPEKIPEMTVGIHLEFRKNRKTYTLKIPCLIRNQERIINEHACNLALWDLSVLSKDTDILAIDISKAVTNGKKKYNMKAPDLLQQKLSQTNVFNPAIDKVTRAEMISRMKEIQGKLDAIHGMCAYQLRTEAEETSLLARAHDLRYQSKFNKVRRQRLMDRRVARNFKSVKKDTEIAHVVSEEELSVLSEEDEKFFFCILSMSSVKDILTDDSSLENAIGIGLAVSRQEHVLDNPTSLKIWSISGALISRSSLMDAFEIKIDVEGALAVHGGFSSQPYDDCGAIAHATVGAGREPINAWLPLYITHSHWKRVQSCLKASLGYLCTLDPLGYAENQLDIFFMVLGYMIGQLSTANVGENQLKLIYAMIKTCRACIEDFHLKTDIIQKVDNFLKNPKGRFRDEIPNLFTLIGYIVALPLLDSKALFLQYDKGTHDIQKNSNASDRLWLGVISELLRRSVSSSDLVLETKPMNILKLLLPRRVESQNSEQKFPSSDLSQPLGHFTRLIATKQMESKLCIPENYLNERDEEPIIVKYSVHVDAAMEVWAQYFCIESAKYKKPTAQLKEAKETINKWLNEVRNTCGLPLLSTKSTNYNSNVMIDDSIETSANRISTEENADGTRTLQEIEINACSNDTGENVFTTSNVNSLQITFLTLKETAKILNLVSQHCFPPLSSIPGCMGFLNHWLSQDGNHKDTSDTTALPLLEWIEGIKKSVQRAFSTMNKFAKDCAENQYFQDHHSANDEIASNKSLKGTFDYRESDFQKGDTSYNQPLDKQRETDNVVTVPMLLSTLEIPENNHVQLIRAMLCQAISFSSNSQARQATDGGHLLDITEERNAQLVLSRVETKLAEGEVAAKMKTACRVAWKYGNECMLMAKTIWSFIGYLLKTHKERGEGFKELIHLILNLPKASRPTFLSEMILVLLTGKYQGHIVFAKGNAWIPEPKLSKLFEKLLGEETWANIELELLSNVAVHVYRESNIPNRHGHCNSNPYIPDRVRTLMGLPSLSEMPLNPNRRSGGGGHDKGSKRKRR